MNIQEIVSFIDGLILHGGSDISPRSYGEKEARPEWSGDFTRDQYEIALYRECRQQRKPILGVCRGAQRSTSPTAAPFIKICPLIMPKPKNIWTPISDKFYHPVVFDDHSVLAKVFLNKGPTLINSIHHQAIKTLGQGLMIEAHSKEDGVVEAIRLSGWTGQPAKRICGRSAVAPRIYDGYGSQLSRLQSPAQSVP